MRGLDLQCLGLEHSAAADMDILWFQAVVCFTNYVLKSTMPHM